MLVGSLDQNLVFEKTTQFTGDPMAEAEDLTSDMYNLAMSEEAVPLLDAVKKHIADNVAPITEEFFRLGEGREDRWSWAPGQLELLQTAKDKAKASGLWNFFLPDAETGEGLKNLDYAYIAAELGQTPLASESLNCSSSSCPGAQLSAFSRLRRPQLTSLPRPVPRLELLPHRTS